MRSSYLTMSWRRMAAPRRRRRRSIQPRSEYHVFLLQLPDFLGREAEQLAEDFLVVLTQDRPGAAKRARRAAEAVLQSFVGRRAHMLVFEPVPEIESLEVFVLMDVDAVLHRIRGDARCLQTRSQIIRRMTAGQGADELIEPLALFDSGQLRGESRVAGVASQSRAHRLPLAVIGNR